jgi:hypothetical protein
MSALLRHSITLRTERSWENARAISSTKSSTRNDETSCSILDGCYTNLLLCYKMTNKDLQTWMFERASQIKGRYLISRRLL